MVKARDIIIIGSIIGIATTLGILFLPKKEEKLPQLPPTTPTQPTPQPTPTPEPQPTPIISGTITDLIFSRLALMEERLFANAYIKNTGNTTATFNLVLSIYVWNGFIWQTLQRQQFSISLSPNQIANRTIYYDAPYNGRFQAEAILIYQDKILDVKRVDKFL